MAKNDYSRRTTKDVFWGDDNNKKKGSKSDELEELFRESEALEQKSTQTPPKSETVYEPEYTYEPEPMPEPEPLPIDYNSNFNFDSLVVSEEEPQQDESESELQEEPQDETPAPPPYEPQTIAPPPYTPSQNTPPAKSKEEVLDGFDVEKFIKDNDTYFNMTIFAKVFLQGFGVFLLLKWLFNDFGRWWLVLIVAFACLVVIQIIFEDRYSKYIALAMKSIKRVISYNKSPKNTIPWGSMIVFPHSDVSATKEDELVVVADETKVTSQEFLFERKVGKNDKETLMMCECYSANMDGRTSFADNIVLTKGKMPYARLAKFRQPVSQYVLHFDDQNCLDECNTPRLLALADSVSAHLGNKPFVMAFSSTNINLAVPIDHLDKFNYNLFDYTIADRIRRDINATVNRVQVANLLAGN